MQYDDRGVVGAAVRGSGILDYPETKRVASHPESSSGEERECVLLMSNPTNLYRYREPEGIRNTAARMGLQIQRPEQTRKIAHVMRPKRTSVHLASSLSQVAIGDASPRVGKRDLL